MVDALLRDGTTSVPALTAELPITRQAVAKHLATLDDAGLVERVPGLRPRGPLPARRGLGRPPHPPQAAGRGRLALVRSPVALVGGALALVRDPVALVSKPVPLIRDTVALVGEPLPLVQDALALVGHPITQLAKDLSWVGLAHRFESRSIRGRAKLAQAVDLQALGLEAVLFGGVVLARGRVVVQRAVDLDHGVVVR